MLLNDILITFQPEYDKSVPDPTNFITYHDGPSRGIILYHFSKKTLNYNLAIVTVGVLVTYYAVQYIKGASSGIPELEPAY